jgi:glutamate-ammonia-ligase adenylyltransferase
MTDSIEKFLLTSQFATSAVKHDPEIISLLNNACKIDGPVNFFKKKGNPDLGSFRAAMDEVRKIKTREMILLLYEDFLEFRDVLDTVSSVASLADWCIDQAIRNAINNNSYKIITYESLQANISILGMGKLGGCELNVSSDIDLIFIISDEYFTEYEITREINKLLVDVLDFLRKATEFGFLYRVDMRLRPEGDSGRLFGGLTNTIEYYKTRGRHWEYQAMIKARAVWGKKIGDQFFEMLYPVVYQRHDVNTILVEIKEVKSTIESKIGNEREENHRIDIKLSQGGIRDIEFIVQFLQMAHGTRHKELRVQSTVTALQRLRNFNIITAEELKTLLTNYKILRKLENILQFKDNLQTSKFPNESEVITTVLKPWAERSTLLNGFHSVDEFLQRIHNVQTTVREIFSSLFDDTINFIILRENVHKKLKETIDPRYVQHHFDRLDSEYFLNNGMPQIINHIQMISQLSYSRLSKVNISTNDHRRYKLTITSFDYDYEFSKIAGLISSYFLKIIRGESYTYSNIEDIKKKSDTPYRRQKRRIYRGYETKAADSMDAIIKKRKIVFLAEVEKSEKAGESYHINWNDFEDDLEAILRKLEDRKQDETEVLLDQRLYEYISISDTSGGEFSPIDIEVDNDSSLLYTILTVKSKDSFAFLYTFTHVLALKNYYIYKVEIDTIDGRINDRIFIMTDNGKKIRDEEKIQELKITIMLIKQYTSILKKAVNPHKALAYFEHLLNRVLESTKSDELPILGQPDVQENLAKIFGISDFIWEDLFRYNYSEMLPLIHSHELEKKMDNSQLQRHFYENYCMYKNRNEIPLDEFTKNLNRFKDIEMFRIDARQILGHIDFWDFAVELTALAEVIVIEALERSYSEAVQKKDFQDALPWAVFGLGKLGGMELGYASDIELMFVYDVPDWADSQVYSFFEQMLKTFLKLIHSKSEGIFEIDMNLRPHGKAGNLAVSLKSFKEYFSSEGGAYLFERQALVKMRHIYSSSTGNYLKDEVLNHRNTFVFHTGGVDLDEMYKLRNKQLESYLHGNLTNVKYSVGGLVEIEYITQLMQMFYGQCDETICEFSTLEALTELNSNQYINNDMFVELTSAYTFYRNLINTLRMVKGNAKDLTINPDDRVEFEYLVKRSHFAGIIQEPDESLLLNLLKKHMDKVNSYFSDLKLLLKD